jgi:NADPH:quinone reductase-like Zn-dependent oxidoreductase
MVEAASVGVAGLTGLAGIRKVGTITPGLRLLITGASSAVGMAAIQLAKAEGAHVTGVCSAASFERVKSLGADELIDYKTSDFATRPEKYDLVFDCVGTKPYGGCQQVLQGRKVHVTVQPGVSTFIRQGLNFLFGVKVFGLVTKGNGEQLGYIKSLIESGKFKTVIDRVFPFAEVAQAQEYSKAGRAKGKIVLTVP